MEPWGGSSHLGPTFDKLANAPGAGFGFLGVSDPVEDGVPIRTRERLKHRLCAGIGTQGSSEILRHLDAGLPGIGGLPSTVLFRLPHLVFTGSMHSAGSDQPFSDGGVPLRPRAASFSRRETSSERSAVTTSQLTINPAEADRLVKSLVVRWTRIKVYETETAPLSEYLRGRGLLRPIDALGDPAEVAKSVRAAVADLVRPTEPL